VDLVPPARTGRRTARGRAPPWATEREVVRALERRGHEVRVVGLDDELLPLDAALDAFTPDAVVNLLEEFDGSTRRVANVVGYLEALGWPVTGCSSQGLALAGDKELAKTLLRAHDVPVAPGFVVPRGRVAEGDRGLGFPLVVKSSTEHGSAGLTDASVVRTGSALRDRVRALQRSLDGDALVERYVEGREIYVPVLGGRPPRALPPWELRRSAGARGPWLATERVKWDRGHQRRRGLVYARASGLTPATARAVARLACRAYAALRLTGPACVDTRIAPDGLVTVLEVNPNPELSAASEVAEAALAVGLSYPVFLERLVRDACARAASA
jgi:D-alanine-D-alanine ligase